MELSINTVGESTRIRITGDIDERGSVQLKAALSEVPLAGINTLCLDFGEVKHIGSAGLGKLLLCYKRFSGSGVTVRLENASAGIRELLAELRLDTLFVIA